jgi:hypothetical protein
MERKRMEFNANNV